MNKYHDTCRILAEGITQSNNTKKTGINNKLFFVFAFFRRDIFVVGIFAGF